MMQVKEKKKKDVKYLKIFFEKHLFWGIHCICCGCLFNLRGQQFVHFNFLEIILKCKSHISLLNR